MLNCPTVLISHHPISAGCWFNSFGFRERRLPQAREISWKMFDKNSTRHCDDYRAHIHTHSYRESRAYKQRELRSASTVIKIINRFSKRDRLQLVVSSKTRDYDVGWKWKLAVWLDWGTESEAATTTTANNIWGEKKTGNRNYYAMRRASCRHYQDTQKKNARKWNFSPYLHETFV